MYTKVFTLKDIFNNKELKDKIPLINYKEKVDTNGKMHKTTGLKSVSYVVYESAKKSATPFYSPLKTSKLQNNIQIGGVLVGDFDTAFETIYQDLLAKRNLMKFTANSGDLIRSALKYSEKLPQAPKLYLRVNSIAQIKSLNNRQLIAFMDNVLENIFYSDNFTEIQKKYKLDTIKIKSPYDYATLKDQWQRRVGEI